MEEERCDLVYSTPSTTLFGVDAGGEVAWIRTPDAGSVHRMRSGAALRREDCLVRSVALESGEERWNATVGRWDVLDFPRAGGMGAEEWGEVVEWDEGGRGYVGQR